MCVFGVFEGCSPVFSAHHRSLSADSGKDFVNLSQKGDPNHGCMDPAPRGAALPLSKVSPVTQYDFAGTNHPAATGSLGRMGAGWWTKRSCPNGSGDGLERLYGPGCSTGSRLRRLRPLPPLKLLRPQQVPLARVELLDVAIGEGDGEEEGKAAERAHIAILRYAQERGGVRF